MRWPSGDQIGQWLMPSSVMFVSTSLVKSYTNTSWLDPSTSIASFLPSGEMHGCRYDRGGSGTCWGLAGPVNPVERSGAAVRFTRNVEEIAVRRDIEIGDAGLPTHHHAFEDGERLPRHFQPILVKGDREQTAVAGVNDVTRRRIARITSALDQDPSLACPCGNDSDRRCRAQWETA